MLGWEAQVQFTLVPTPQLTWAWGHTHGFEYVYLPLDICHLCSLQNMSGNKDLENSTRKIKAGFMNVLANHLTVNFVKLQTNSAKHFVPKHAQHSS